MSNSPNVTALRVADEDFLVASMIERCPKTMMIRELVMNAIEATVNAPSGEQTIELMPKLIGGVEKLCIWNSGPGMSSEELHQICDFQQRPWERTKGSTRILVWALRSPHCHLIATASVIVAVKTAS